MSNKGVELQKSQNVKKILQIIRNSDDISKNRIKELTGLSFATVSAVCNELVAKDILEEESYVDAKLPGRIPKRLSIKKHSYFAICLDLQNFGVVDISIQDLSGSTIFQGCERYASPLEIDDVLRRIHAVVQREAERFQIERTRFIGVGAAISGIFDLRTETIEECAIPQWDGLDLKRRLQNAFDMPAYVDNEANLCASQLLSYPSDGGSGQNIVYLHLGEGIGVGVIVDGKLLCGETGYAAEISHLPIGNPEIHCSRCGNYGCAEMELSKAGFIQKYEALKGLPSASLDWEAFVRTANGRDPCALQVLRENGEMIADCVITLMMLFDPKEFYIGGSILDVYKFISMIVENRIGRLGRHYARIPILLETGREQAVTNGIMEMLILRWDL